MDHCLVKNEDERDPQSMEKLLLSPIKLFDGDKKGLPLLVGRLGVRGEGELSLLSIFMLSPDSELAVLSATDDMMFCVVRTTVMMGIICELGRGGGTAWNSQRRTS